MYNGKTSRTSSEVRATSLVLMLRWVPTAAVGDMVTSCMEASRMLPTESPCSTGKFCFDRPVTGGETRSWSLIALYDFSRYEFNGRRLQVRLERFENHTLNGGASSGANGGFNMRSNPSNPTPPSQANQAFAHPSSQQTSARSSHNGGPPPISIGMIYPLYGYEPPSPFHAPPSPFYGPSSPFHAPFQPPPLVQHLGSQPMVNLSTASQPPSSNFSSEAGNKALSQSRAAVITQIEPAVPHYSRANHPQRIALPPAYPMFGNGIPGNQGVSIGAMSPIQRNLPLMTPSMPSFQFGAFPVSSLMA